MPPSAGRRRSEIVAAARELFSEKGYHSASMRDIAERLGLQAGTLYVHIRSKEDVLFEIVDQAADRFLEAVRQARAEAESRGASPEEALRLAMRSHLRVVAENLDTATVFFHEWKFLDDDRRALILAKRDAYESAIRDLIIQGIESGVFRPVDPRLAGLAVLSLSNWFYQWYSPAGPQSAEDIADAFADLLLAGLLGGPQAAASDEARDGGGTGSPTGGRDRTARRGQRRSAGGSGTSSTVVQ